MKTVIINNAQEWPTAVARLVPDAKALLMSGQRVMITAKSATRSNEASAKFHAMCGDFAKSFKPWAGKPRSLEEWKVLLISGHAVATKLGAEVIPGIENEFVNIRESSARMGVRRMASLIEYSYAFGTSIGVKFTAPAEAFE